MSSASNLLAAGLLLLSCTAGWAQTAPPRRAQAAGVERVVRLPPVDPGEWVPKPALGGDYPRTSDGGAADRGTPNGRSSAVGHVSRVPRTVASCATYDGRDPGQDRPPTGTVDAAVYVPQAGEPPDGPGEDGPSLGRFGTSAGIWTPGGTDPPDAGPVFDGLDSPNAVSPAFGGTDATGGAHAPLGPIDPQAELVPDGQPQCWFGSDGRLSAELRRRGQTIWRDHRHFYSWRSIYGTALGFAAGGAMANTSIDQHFRNWYRDDVRCSGTDNVASFFKTFGEGRIFIPAFAGLAVLDIFCDDLPVLGVAGDFGDRVTRAYLVGAPPMLVMQLVTGASRPGEASHDSQWRPFTDNNGVSGHAFMGAVPFLTAARMCDNFWLKSGLYILSTFTAWSRVNDDRHYLSQACLGWWMAYMACRAVDQTEYEERLFSLAPIATPEMTGVAIILRR